MSVDLDDSDEWDDPESDGFRDKLGKLVSMIVYVSFLHVVAWSPAFGLDVLDSLLIGIPELIVLGSYVIGPALVLLGVALDWFAPVEELIISSIEEWLGLNRRTA